MKSFARKRSLPGAVLAALMALLVLAPVAPAAEDPALVEAREEYKERVEPICKSSTDANARILKGVQGQVDKGDLVPAGKRFIRASSAFGKAVKKIAAVPRPAPYQTLLTKWIDALGEEKALLLKIGQALKAEKRNKAYRHSTQLKRVNNRANNIVLNFELDHCRIEPDKFL